MRCPSCHQPETKVIDSRSNQSDDVTRRRRVCETCGYRYTTYERVEETVPAVIKKDGRRETFSREKMISGMTKACQKRPVHTNKLDNMADEVIKSLQGMGEKEVDSQVIGYLIMNKLRLVDEVAYIRFASVYRSFRDIEEFVQEIQEQKDRPVHDTSTEPLFKKSVSKKTIYSQSASLIPSANNPQKSKGSKKRAPIL